MDQAEKLRQIVQDLKQKRNARNKEGPDHYRYKR